MLTNENQDRQASRDYFKQNNIDNGEFNHFKPATYLLKHQAELADKIGDLTVQRASQLFERINALL